MKRIASVFLLIIIVFTLTACGDAADMSDQEENLATPLINNYEETSDGNNYDEIFAVYTNDEDEAKDNSTDYTQFTSFTLVYNGVTIEMDQDMGYLLPLLGEPLGVFEAPSCAFDGIDRIFGFTGIQIHTYPDGSLDRVHTISFLNDSITTREGITLGNNLGDVVAAYGNDYKQDINMFTFTIGRTTLSFFIENDMVTGIIYGLIMD